MTGYQKSTLFEILTAKKKELSHQASREFAEELFGDPYLVDAKGRTAQFVIQHHLRGIWTEEERKDILKRMKAVASQEELETIWKQNVCEYLTEPVDNWRKEIQAIDEKRGDVDAVLNKYLSKACPKLGDLDLTKVIQRGNIHTDLRMKVPDKDYLVGWTITDPRVVLQYLETGDLEMPLRDKFLENQPDDKSPCTRKAAQPQTWFYLVDEKNPVFEAAPGEVGATVEAGGRFIFKTRGKVAWGIQKDDYHEMYFWFDKPYEALSGRWGFQKLAGRQEYLKVPAVWWMVDRPHRTQAPYILQNTREEVEAKAKRERLKSMIYNPEILAILQKDEQGRKWMQIGLKRELSSEFIKEKFDEWKASGAKWSKE